MRCHIAALIRDLNGIRLDEVFSGDWTIVNASNGEIELVQVAFRKCIMSSGLLLLQLACVREEVRSQTYKAVKEFVKAGGMTTLWKVPEHQVVCELIVGSILATDTFQERFITNVWISRIPSIFLPFMFGKNTPVVTSK